MCCGNGVYHHPRGWGRCCSPPPRFPTVDEELELLKRDKRELEEEIADIERRIERLKGEGK